MVRNQGISLSRDHCILNLLRSHLMQAEENNPECSQIQQILTQFKQVFEQLGLLLSN